MKTPSYKRMVQNRRTKRFLSADMKHEIHEFRITRNTEKHSELEIDKKHEVQISDDRLELSGMGIDNKESIWI